MQLPERTERSVSYTRYQLLVACGGKSGEGEFILYLNIAETFVLGTSVVMYIGTINSCLAADNKLTPKGQQKANDESCAKENASQA